MDKLYTLGERKQPQSKTHYSVAQSLKKEEEVKITTCHMETQLAERKKFERHSSIYLALHLNLGRRKKETENYTKKETNH